MPSTSRSTALIALLTAACASAPDPKLAALLRKPAVSQFIRALPDLAATGLAAAKAALGVHADALRNVPFVFAAAAMPNDPGRCRGFWRHGIARAVTLSRGSVRSHHIVLCLDKIPPRPDYLRGVLTHEISHVVLSHALGSFRRNLPRCLEEGIAEHVAGKGHHRVLRWLRAVLRKRGRLPRLKGFARLLHANPSGRYAECVLHTRFLLERAGNGALARLVQALAGGASFPEAAQKLTGLGQAAYALASDAWAGRALSELRLALGREPE